MHFTRLAALWFALTGCVAPVALASDEAPSHYRYIVYYNADASPVTDAIGLPYTHIILSFIGATRNGNKIEITVPDKLKLALLAVPKLKADGKTVMISFGGGAMGNDDYVPLAGHETALARAIADFVKAHGLDGVDIDFEVSAALQETPPDGTIHGRPFLVKLTSALRKALGPAALISHAPQGPYLNPAWHGGPYLEILRAAGDEIDWINVQYYNNPDFNAPIVAGDPSWSYSGLTSGKYGLDWPPYKTVVAKPIYRDDAGTGYVAPEKLLRETVHPLVKQYGRDFGGLAGWQFSTHTDDHVFWNTQMGRAFNSSKDAKQP